MRYASCSDEPVRRIRIPFARSIVLRFSSAPRAAAASFFAVLNSRARLTARRSVESSTRGGVGFGRNAIAAVAATSRSLSEIVWSPLNSTTATPGTSFAICSAASIPDPSGMCTSSSTTSGTTSFARSIASRPPVTSATTTCPIEFSRSTSSVRALSSSSAMRMRIEPVSGIALVEREMCEPM